MSSRKTRVALATCAVTIIAAAWPGLAQQQGYYGSPGPSYSRSGGGYYGPSQAPNYYGPNNSGPSPAYTEPMDHWDDMRPNRIRIAYDPPTKDENKTVYETVKQRQALERLQRLFSPLELPNDLTIKTMECGQANAYYKRPTVTICYEYLADLVNNAPKDTTPEGVTMQDAVVGQFYFTAAHEMGHAVFDQLEVPVLGREEDAADQVAAYIMLAVGKQSAHQLITGAAYAYRRFFANPQVTLPVTAFSDVHGSSVQRFYNLMCIAYGADSKMFADVVDKGYLPKKRAEHCAYEYWNVRYAFQRLIRPYLDPELRRQVLESSLLEEVDPPRQDQAVEARPDTDPAKAVNP
jgi:hypothetical protein